MFFYFAQEKQHAMRTVWKECENLGRGKAQWAGIYVTLNPRGHLVLGRHAVAALGEPKRVKVLYDAFNNRLGLRRVPEQTPKSFGLAKRGSHGARVVHIYGVLATEDIKVPETIHFQDAYFDEQENALVLDLRTARVSERVKRNYWNKKKGSEG